MFDLFGFKRTLRNELKKVVIVNARTVWFVVHNNVLIYYNFLFLLIMFSFLLVEQLAITLIIELSGTPRKNNGY